METLKLDISKTGVAVSAAMQAKAQAANALLESGKGAGSDFLGWVHLPSSITPDRIEAIEKQAAKLREKAEVIICIGIGGSYLGAKAVLEAMSDSFKFLHKKRTEPVVVFAGQNISEDYTHELLEAVKEYSIATIVISKSGTTTEPAIAFRLIKAEIEKRYGKQEAAERIVAITDKARGALKTLADQRGLPDVRHSRRRGRTLLGADSRGPAAAGRRRRGHRRTGARRAGDGARDGRRHAVRKEPGGSLRSRAQRAVRTAARRSRFSAPTSPSSNTSTSGGNSSTARAKASRARASSRPASR